MEDAEKRERDCLKQCRIKSPLFCFESNFLTWAEIPKPDIWFVEKSHYNVHLPELKLIYDELRIIFSYSFLLEIIITLKG